MDWPIAVIAVAGFGTVIALYGIYAASRDQDNKRKIDHEEFKEKLKPSHDENLARIEAQVRSDVVKYTGKPANAVQQIDQR
jgi:hypothetical protein